MKTRRGRRVDQTLRAYSTTADAMLAMDKHRKLGKDWVAYAAAAGAALAMAPSAEASIIYSGPQNITASRFGPKNLDLDGDAVNDFRIFLLRDQNVQGTALGYAGFLRTLATHNRIVATGNSAKKFALNSVISAGGNLLGGTRLLRAVLVTTSNATKTILFGKWKASQTTSFAGVRFGIGSGDHFGWIRIHVTDDHNGVPDSVTAVDWAYCSDPGVGINAGATQGDCLQAGGQAGVPEPSGLALLAAGAGGVLAWRRRRQSSPTP